MDVFGIEPARNVAADAIGRGVPTHVGFCRPSTWGRNWRRRASAPGSWWPTTSSRTCQTFTISSAARGAPAPGGLLSVELHHLLHAVTHGQFDTIYHEHFQYFLAGTVRRALAAHASA
jgi:hypothetical protein